MTATKMCDPCIITCSKFLKLETADGGHIILAENLWLQVFNKPRGIEYSFLKQLYHMNFIFELHLNVN